MKFLSIYVVPPLTPVYLCCTTTTTEVNSLPSPSQPRLEHINISAVLISWTYPFSDVPPPIQFTVQMEKDATLYKNISELLNDTDYIYIGMKLGGRYQFRVIANRYGQSSDPSEPSYVFTNGETGLTCS